VTEDELRAKIQELKEGINDYCQSIQAMIGFVNFYVYDDTTRRDRTDVIAFQGWRLTPRASNPAQASPGNTSVTPDFGILMPNRMGVVGEVKKSFPKDQQHWSDDFKQLMGYDSDFVGWPSESKTVDGHDIVLLTHQTRAVTVEDYYRAKQECGEVKFTKPFIIVEFNESHEAKAFLFFRTRLGQLSWKHLDEVLRLGKGVPMQVFVAKYSTIKFYDAQPPNAYMIEVIWTNVVMAAVSDKPAFRDLKKRQKLEISLPVDQIVTQLREGFSFRAINYEDVGPRIPERNWVEEACQTIVDLGEGEWADKEKTTLMVRFRKYDNVSEHFREACARASIATAEGVTAKQRTLFK
jgi:hypothetical protein